MFPISLLKIAPYVAALRLLVAELPDGDVVRTRIEEAEGGVRATVERQQARSDVVARQDLRVPKGDYSWRIDEEKRTVLMAAPGRPTGVVRRAFRLTLLVDRRDPRSVNPNPVEAFRFYAPTRESAEELRESLKKALSLKR